MKSVAVCGTPGSGKSTLIKRLHKEMPACHVINVSELVKQERLYEEYDDDMDACVMDSRAVRRRLRSLLEQFGDEPVVIETHTPSVLPRKLVRHCIVLQCETHVLYDRLTDRQYSARKREENVQAEIMQVVREEAVECLGERRVRCRPNNCKEDLRSNLKLLVRLLNKL